MVPADAAIVSLIRRYALARGVSQSYSSFLLSGSGTTIKRIERGCSLTARRAAGIIQKASDLWPAGSDGWPTDIPRPPKTPEAA